MKAFIHAGFKRSKMSYFSFSFTNRTNIYKMISGNRIIACGSTRTGFYDIKPVRGFWESYKSCDIEFTYRNDLLHNNFYDWVESLLPNDVYYEATLILLDLFHDTKVIQITLYSEKHSLEKLKTLLVLAA